MEIGIIHIQEHTALTDLTNRAGVYIFRYSSNYTYKLTLGSPFPEWGNLPHTYR